MGDTFGCTCCCTDDQLEGNINMDKKQKQFKSTEHTYIDFTDTTKLLGESEEPLPTNAIITNTNTNSYNNDNQDYSTTNDNDNHNDSSISEMPDINQQQTDENIIINTTENDSIENVNNADIDQQTDEKIIINTTDSETKENDSIETENIIETNTDEYNRTINTDEYNTTINKYEQNIQHSITENIQMNAENITNKQEYSSINSEKSENENNITEIIITEPQNDNINQLIQDNKDIDEDFDEDLAKLGNIQNYDDDNDKKENEMSEINENTNNNTIIENKNDYDENKSENSIINSEKSEIQSDNTNNNIIIENKNDYDEDNINENENENENENKSEKTNDSFDMDAEMAKLDNIKNYDIEKVNINNESEHDNIIHMRIPNNNNNNDEKSIGIDNELNESRSRLLLKRYKSENEMLDDESIESLLQMKLSNGVFKILGNQKLYSIPIKKEDRFHLERDLRKIKLALKHFRVSEQRKYAKIAILKHIYLLTAVYIKYCKIGGDRHWLTYDGWISLLRDSNLIKMGDYNDEYFQIFTKTYNFHNKKNNKSKSKGKKARHSTQLSGLYGGVSFHDKNPWTGVWCMEKDKQRINRIEKKKREKEERDRIIGMKQKNKIAKKLNKKISIKQKSEEHFDRYKLRKIGDLRIIGCMNNIEYGDIAGMTNKSNYKKAKLEIRFKKRRIKVHNQKRIWNCLIQPPKSIMDNIIMRVKWREINEKSSKEKDGTFKLYKYDELKDNDIDLPISQYVGLARYEFFDAILQLSCLLNKNNNNNTKDLYETFDELCVKYLNEYIYKNIIELDKYMALRDINEDIRIKIKGYNIILIKLFKKYASLDNDEITTKHEQHLDCDEWCAMAVELCKAAKSFDKYLWKLGGKPSMNEIIQCFILCKDEDLIMDEEIDFIEFQRCLILFTNTVFKYSPKARYQIMDFDHKIDLVLKWCEKLEVQKVAISSKSYHRSDTLKHIKRKKSMHQNAQSNQASLSTFEFNTPTFNNKSNRSNPIDWNNVAHSF